MSKRYFMQVDTVFKKHTVSDHSLEIRAKSKKDAIYKTSKKFRCKKAKKKIKVEFFIYE